jgi:hypothetical protein
MANAGSPDFIFMFDNVGGTPVNMSQYLLSVGGVSVEAMTEESHAFGDSWQETLATGIRKMNPLDVEGLYDDVATVGPNAIFNDVADGPADTTRTMTITWRTGKTTSVETLIAKHERIASRGALTRYRTTLQPTGAVTEV